MGARKSISLFGGSNASPARPSGRYMKIKMCKEDVRMVTAASNKGHKILISN